MNGWQTHVKGPFADGGQCAGLLKLWAVVHFDVVEAVMAVNSILSTGVQGVQAGLQRANRAAGEIARFGTTEKDGGLATPIVDLKRSELQVKASAAVIRSADEVVGTLIDIKA
jgi:hypothetical protein